MAEIPFCTQSQTKRVPAVAGRVSSEPVRQIGVLRLEEPKIEGKKIFGLSIVEVALVVIAIGVLLRR